MTLDYKKMFLIVTEEAVVKGHFTSSRRRLLVHSAIQIVTSHPLGNVTVVEWVLFTQVATRDYALFIFDSAYPGSVLLT